MHEEVFVTHIEGELCILSTIIVVHAVSVGLISGVACAREKWQRNGVTH